MLHLIEDDLAAAASKKDTVFKPDTEMTQTQKEKTPKLQPKPEL
jgi:hypothetical protein